MDGAVTSSTERPSALPDAWVDRLFQRFLATYGTEKFTALWRGQNMDEVKALWADELSGFSAAEIRAGLDALRRVNQSWPPTMLEFAELCRPTAIDHEAAFAEAVKGVYARRDGQPGVWSHRAIYWAVQDVSAFDVLNSSWRDIKARWIKALTTRLADPNLQAIPEPPKRLPEPPKGDVPPNVKELATHLTSDKRNMRLWVEKILERKERNDPTLSDYAYRMALNSVNVR